jgi:hypothetical protein
MFLGRALQNGPVKLRSCRQANPGWGPVGHSRLVAHAGHGGAWGFVADPRDFHSFRQSRCNDSNKPTPRPDLKQLPSQPVPPPGAFPESVPPRQDTEISSPRCGWSAAIFVALFAYICRCCSGSAGLKLAVDAFISFTIAGGRERLSRLN